MSWLSYASHLLIACSPEPIDINPNPQDVEASTQISKTKSGSFTSEEMDEE